MPSSERSVGWESLWIEKNTAPLVAANRLATKLSFPANFTQLYLEVCAQSSINGKKSLLVYGSAPTIQTAEHTGLEARSLLLVCSFEKGGQH